MLGSPFLLGSGAGPLPAGAVAGSGGDRGGQVGRAGPVAARRAGRVRGEVVAGGAQDDGEGDLVGVDAQVDGGGHGLVDDRVVDGEQAPDLLLGQVGGLPAQAPARPP